jgi:uncharacterized membrane protein YfcA
MTGLLVSALLVSVVGGLIRGMTGFGGSLVMTPILTMLFSPRQVVPPVLLLEAFAATPMLAKANALACYRILAPICLASFATLPLGAYVLVHAEPDVLRRGIAGMVIVFSALLLCGVRYRGPRPVALSAGLGGICGVLLGATGIGAPPVILYLLSGPDPLAVTRANLTLYVAAISVAALIVLWAQGVFVSAGGALSPLAMAPCYYGGIVIGSHLFSRTKETALRQFALALLMTVCAVALFR